MLIAGYSEDHLNATQIEFWNTWRNDRDFIRADIIMCGFDVWHCLIIAPYVDKKMILNSAYRFDGHIAINKKNAQKLQKILYNAVRYNPDIIMAGSIAYDVMYQQHFLGSHKMIPLPATCLYTLKSVKEELARWQLFECSW